VTDAAQPAASGPSGPPTVATVEALVRKQMATALGGRRGMLEAAIPGILFTVLWLTTRDLRTALVASVAVAVVALVARLVQRSSPQYVFNALFAIAIGWVFVRLAASTGGSESEQALAFFLPGILISLGYTILMSASCVVGWPFIGFMLGSVTGDPLAWHEDKQVVRLCTRLTWLFLAPGCIGVLLQGPVWLLGWSGAIDIDLAVLILGILRVGLGWPLRILAWASMIWLLARDATPIEEGETGLTG
jgi:hypothetical protein